MSLHLTRKLISPNLSNPPRYVSAFVRGRSSTLGSLKRTVKTNKCHSRTQTAIARGILGRSSREYIFGFPACAPPKVGSQTPPPPVVTEQWISERFCDHTSYDPRTIQAIAHLSSATIVSRHSGRRTTPLSGYVSSRFQQPSGQFLFNVYC